MMTDVGNLLKRVAAEEKALRSRLILAPCVRGGALHAEVEGLLYTFAPRPRDFEGWALFRPVNEREAQLVEEAELACVTSYLKQFPSMRLRLGYRLKGSAWIAFREKNAEPLLLHLVTEGAEFDEVIARSLHGVWWFEEVDRRASPLLAEGMRAALRDRVAPERLAMKGITQRMRDCYTFVYSRAEREQERRLFREARKRVAYDEERLREALRFGGGQLQSFNDRREFWLVEWLARNGQTYFSAIAKDDLTVIGAGICLSGEDSKFDLQSLVGVAEGA